MAEPTIICPKCKNEIKLTESLAAPLIESTRRDFEQRLAQTRRLCVSVARFAWFAVQPVFCERISFNAKG